MHCSLPQNQNTPARKLKNLLLRGDKPGFIEVCNAREARELQRGQAETHLRTEQEKKPMALLSLREEVCIQTGQLKKVYTGWQRGSWPSLPFLWWEALWSQAFAMGIHSISDGWKIWDLEWRGKAFKSWSSELLLPKIKKSQLPENLINHSQNKEWAAGGGRWELFTINVSSIVSSLENEVIWGMNKETSINHPSCRWRRKQAYEKRGKVGTHKVQQWEITLHSGSQSLTASMFHFKLFIQILGFSSTEKWKIKCNQPLNTFTALFYSLFSNNA